MENHNFDLIEPYGNWYPYGKSWYGINKSLERSVHRPQYRFDRAVSNFQSMDTVCTKFFQVYPRIISN